MTEGVLLAKIEDIDKSKRGYVSALTRLCNELHEHLIDFVNVVKVKDLQVKLHAIWKGYETCFRNYGDLIDQSCEKYQQLSLQYSLQQGRVKEYDD